MFAPTILHQLRLGRGIWRLSLLPGGPAVHLVQDGPRPAELSFGLRPLEFGLGLTESDGLDDDGQGQGEESDSRHHRPQAYAGLLHGSVLNCSV
jgi:hypothetical protein